MYKVDYSESWDGSKTKFVSEQSFSVLDWVLADKLIKGRQMETNADTMKNEVMVQLTFNIFPGGKTFLHKIADELL